MRISFFGGGTDYPAWYRKQGGSVLATTINKYCYLTCRYLPPFFEHRIRLVYSKIENCQTPEEIQHPAAREVLGFLNIDRGIEIHHDGDLPARSGMGTSSAFTVGLLHALHALKGQMVGRRQLAQESIHIEQDILHETVGSQDQILAAYGGFNQIEFPRDGEISVNPVTVPEERLSELNSHLLLIYSGLKRTASNIAESYVQDIQSRQRQLHSMAAMVNHGISILNSGEDITSFGELLNEAWLEKRSLSSQVSNSRVDEIYRQAISAGAIGGKLLGAGGGGFMLFFVPPSKHVKVKETLNRLICVPFKFEFSGSQIIFFEPEEDYSTEDRVRANQPPHKFEELEGSSR